MPTEILYPNSNAPEGFGWNSPENAYTDDGNTSGQGWAANLAAGAIYHRWGDFNVDSVIPSTAAINFIRVEAEVNLGSAASAFLFYFYLQPVISNTLQTPQTSVAGNNINTTPTLIGDTQTYNFTRGQLLNGIFQIRLGFGRASNNSVANTGNADFVRLFVDYTDMLPAVPTGLTVEILTSGD